jgi:hypothetical protein
VPEAGDAYTYSASEPLGNDPGSVAPGTRVTVREVVPADVQGAHDDSEDAVVVETEDGRAWSVGLQTFASDYTEES